MISFYMRNHCNVHLRGFALHILHIHLCTCVHRVTQHTVNNLAKQNGTLHPPCHPPQLAFLVETR